MDIQARAMVDVSLGLVHRAYETKAIMDIQARAMVDVSLGLVHRAYETKAIMDIQARAMVDVSLGLVHRAYETKAIMDIQARAMESATASFKNLVTVAKENSTNQTATASYGLGKGFPRSKKSTKQATG